MSDHVVGQNVDAHVRQIREQIVEVVRAMPQDASHGRISLHHQDCEVLCRINKQRLDIAGGVNVNKDDLDTSVDDQSVMFGYAANETEDARPLTCWRAAAVRDRSIQQHNNELQTGAETKKEKGKEVQEETDQEVQTDQEVEKDVMDWTLVTRSKKQRRKTSQIIVKVDGSRTIAMETALSDKVGDVVKKIPTSACCNKSDVYAMCEGKVLRRGEESRRCGVSEGSVVQMVNKMRGGGKHKDKKSKEKKQVAQLDDGRCAMACEKIRLITESANKSQSTDEDK